MLLGHLLGVTIQVTRELSAMPALRTARRLTPAPVPTSRCTVVAPGRTDVRLRGAHEPGNEDACRDLERELLSIGGVHRAEVNAVLGRVRIDHDPEIPAGDLVSAVKELERRNGLHSAGFLPHPHPGDLGTVRTEARKVAANLAGCGLALAAKTLRLPALPPASSTVLILADMTPAIREGIRRAIGDRATDLLFGPGITAAHLLGQEPADLAIDALQGVVRCAEAQAHKRAWDRRAPDLDADLDDFRARPLEHERRPVPLPPSPVERAMKMAPVTLAAGGAAFAITRNAQRAQSVLTAGVPRAAWLGRETFSALFGAAAAEQGVVTRDIRSLRRLDRLTAVLIDASALTTGQWRIDEVIPAAAGATAEECYAHALELIDVARPDRRRTRKGWAVTPLGAAAVPPPVREAAEQCRRRGGRPLALRRHGEFAGFVSVLPELDPLAAALVAAGRRVGPVVLAGQGTGIEERLPVDRVLPGGADLRASVRKLQKDGHGVALVGGRSPEALAVADVSIGLLGGPDGPPWAAHFLCGPGLAGVYLLLDAVQAARESSLRSARISVVGSVAGLLLAAAGPAYGASARAGLAVQAAKVLAMADGAWTSVTLARRPAPVPEEPTPWHAWPADAVLSTLDSSEQGLASEEAARRRAGRAAEEAPPPPGFGRILIEELDNPLTPALAAGAGISAVLGSAVDAALIAGVLGVNAAMSGVQRLGVDRALRRLVDLSAVRTRVRRPESETPVPVSGEELVPGDVIAVTAGDSVPADCRVLAAEDLEVDESSLTGESQLVAKSPASSTAGAVAERSSMLYQGTVVAVGEAIAVVVATGDRTEIGRTTRLAPEEGRAGGVQAHLRRLTDVTLPVSLGAGVVLMVAQLLRGLPLGEALGPAVALTVGAVPEGLPFVATAAQLATARRLSARGALVRDPSTIEPLGRVDVLCFDKTGTLTEGRLRLRQVSDGVTSRPLDELTPRMRDAVAAALRANPDHNGGRLPHPTDRAIMRGAEQLEMEPTEDVGEWERVDELPFEPSRGYHAVLGQTPAGQLLSVKGAPEILLDRCSRWITADGVAEFDAAVREAVHEEVERLARKGYRVLAVAERPASDRADLTESRIRDLCFMGLLGIADPIRPTAAEAVRRLASAGAQVIVVTGDHPSTAEAVAAELGVLDGRVATGAELDAVDDDRLAEEIANVVVFARMSPEQKARVVRALRGAGRVVAVTGDGANDVPAIRLADVGIALGKRATSAAREAADVVVTDNRIETIAEAIAESRAMWKSTRNALAVLLGGNLGEVAFTVGASLISGRSPLNVRQLLLVNLLTDMLPAIALAVRSPRDATPDELLQEGPERSLGTVLGRDIGVRAATTALAAQTTWLLARPLGTRAQTDTTALVALVGTQLAQTVAAGGRDPLVTGAGLLSLAVLAVVVQTPGLSHFFGCRPLAVHGWAVGLGTSVVFSLVAAVFTRRLGAADVSDRSSGRHPHDSQRTSQAATNGV
ncbi:HAD-IC family P-type ATPase [Marinactinospora rubrisoli]|uniref:HAD-IC family P-type ATPase n=1 Tax=Marinactinospora rubrisoli TaxID=2715399 RepID=A0ABW2KFX9_9ACTN